jgi:hypothetical protein
MTISPKDSKRLWGRAGSRCSLCNKELTQIEGFETIVGQEAHIRSKKANGPRYELDFPADKIDAYENMILMCQEHHTLIDANVDSFPAKALEEMKRRHEARVDRALSPKQAGWVNDPEFQLVVNGTQLMGFAHSAHAFLFDHDHPQNDTEKEAIASFLQNVQDWSDISEDIGVSGRVNASADLHQELLHLHNLGFLVLADVEDYRAQGMTFATLALKVVRAENPDSSPTEQEPS